MMHYILVIWFSIVLAGPAFYALRGPELTKGAHEAFKILFRIVTRCAVSFGQVVVIFTAIRLRGVNEISNERTLLHEAQK